MLQKAEKSVEKELDLVKFIHRLRLTSYVALMGLNGRQQYVADRMS